MPMLFKTLTVTLLNVLFCSLSFALELTEINNFRLVKFNVHLIQEKSKTNYLTDTKIEYAIQQTIEKFLPSRKETNAPTLDLEIYLHIHIRPGTSTMSYVIQGAENGSLTLDYKSPILNTPFTSKCASIDDYEKVICAVPSILSGRHIVQVISELTSNFDYGKNSKEDELMAFHNQLIESTNKKFLYSRNSYIPDAASKQLIANINNEKERERIKNYNRIRDGWIYTPELELAIINKINELIPTATADSSNKELRYAMNALASLGAESTIDTFKKIQNTPNLPYNVAKEILDSVTIFNDRRLLARRVHNTANFNNSESWDVNQLYNRLSFHDIELISAMKEIFENHPDNDFLLKKLSSILESDMRHETWRDEVDSWICKIIEKSGNKNYLPLVQTVEQKASSEKIQDYAKSAIKRLSKLK